MGLTEALEYTPTDSTYVIRIKYSPKLHSYHDDRPLQESSLFRRIQSYGFDDTDPHFPLKDRKHLDIDLAKQIINDFAEGRNGCETLLVHCRRGVNRSPAVAIALNDIFNLGEDTDKLMEKHPEYHRWTYNILLSAAGKIK